MVPRFEKRSRINSLILSTTNTDYKSEHSDGPKKHRNKYLKFSKKMEDPIDVAVKRIKEEEETIKMERSAPSRGTTVPNIFTYTARKRKTAFSNVNIINPSDPFTFGYERIGVLSGPHGVKGELKIQMETDFAEFRVSNGSTLYLKRPNRRTPRPITVKSGRRQVGNTYLVCFERVCSRESAEAFKNFIVYARVEDRPKLMKDEYLVRDLVGLQCYRYAPGSSQTLVGPMAEVVGVVPPEDLCDPAAAKFMHAMLELQLIRSTSSPTSFSDTPDLCLVPLVPEIVLEVDLVLRRIILDPPGGLLELTYKEPPPKIALRGFLPEVASVSDELRAELALWTTFV
eukprot:gene1589-3070_t